MSQTPPATLPQTVNRQRVYLNAILTVNAALMGLLVVNTITPLREFEAVSQAQFAAAGAMDGVEDPSGRISAAEQRKQIIAEIRQVSGRVERVEQILSRGLNVKVTELPASFMKGLEAKSAERAEPRTLDIRTRPAEVKSSDAAEK